MTEKTRQLDARNLLCPLPVIRTQDFVRNMAAGEVVVVTCTDPGAINDIPAWSRIYGHKVLEIEQDKNEIRIKILVVDESDQEPVS